MDHADLYALRKTYNTNQILLCFNGPFSQGLIEEIGNALRKYMQGEAAPTSAALDVFAIYIEIAQNIRHYCVTQDYNEADSSATVVISRAAEGHYAISAGNVVEAGHGRNLIARIEELAALDKAQLKATYKEQLRKPREDGNDSAGLGLIDIARKASAPISCSLVPTDSQRMFFSLHVAI